MKIYYLFAAAFLCNCSNKNTSNGPSFPLQDTNSLFKKEIPVYPGGKQSGFFESAKTSGKQLNLESIDSGFNGLQLRVWYSFYNGQKLLVITNIKKEWSVVLYLVKEDPNGHDLILSAKEKKHIFPKSGWSYFAKKLQDLEVLTLAEMTYGSALPNDSDCFSVEVATRNSYRIYTYCDPDNFQDQNPPARKMMEVLKFFKDELGVPYKGSRDEFK